MTSRCLTYLSFGILVKLEKIQQTISVMYFVKIHAFSVFVIKQSSKIHTPSAL